MGNVPFGSSKTSSDVAFSKSDPKYLSTGLPHLGTLPLGTKLPACRAPWPSSFLTPCQIGSHLWFSSELLPSAAHYVAANDAPATALSVPLPYIRFLFFLMLETDVDPNPPLPPTSTPGKTLGRQSNAAPAPCEDTSQLLGWSNYRCDMTATSVGS